MSRTWSILTLSLLALPAAADVIGPGAACGCAHTGADLSTSAYAFAVFAVGAMLLLTAHTRR